MQNEKLSATKTHRRKASGQPGVVMTVYFVVYGVGRTIDLPPSRWYREALLPTVGVLVPATAAAVIVHFLMPDGVWRLLAVTTTYAVVGAALLWWVGLAGWEREKFVGFANSLMNRVTGARQARARQ
jgi:hypothetical protein